jgi:hypothetical protein
LSGPISPPIVSWTARAGKRRFGRLITPRAHTKPPFKTD